MAKKTKKIKILKANKSYLIIGFVSIVFILMIIVILGLNRRVNNLDENAGVQSLAFFIREANDSLTKEAPTASYSSDQFIDEMKIKFDNSSPTKIYYFYNLADDENNLKESVTITSNNLKQTSLSSLYSSSKHDEFFNLIPGVQACQRPYLLTTDDEKKELYGNYSYIDSVQLNDGRKMNILKNDDQLCPHSEFLLEDLLTIIKKVQSY